MKTILPVVIALALGITLLAGCGNAQSCPKIGDKAPDFTLTSMDGKNVSLSSFAGKPVIINTWDIDCIRCKEEMPYFQDLYSIYFKDRIAFVSIDTGSDNTGSIKDFLVKNGYTFTVCQDYGNKVFKPKLCLPVGNPCTIFIDTKGIIKNVKIGNYTDKSQLESEIKKFIDQL